MKWLEIINLRSTDGNREMLESTLQKLFDQVEKEKQGVRTYRRVMIDSDFSIHLHYDSENPDTVGSPLGLRLASALKQFGLVNHSIWKEWTNK